jgi:hypothetical protein
MARYNKDVDARTGGTPADHAYDLAKMSELNKLSVAVGHAKPYLYAPDEPAGGIDVGILSQNGFHQRRVGLTAEQEGEVLQKLSALDNLADGTADADVEDDTVEAAADGPEQQQQPNGGGTAPEQQQQQQQQQQPGGGGTAPGQQQQQQQPDRGGSASAQQQHRMDAEVQIVRTLFSGAASIRSSGSGSGAGRGIASAGADTSAATGAGAGSSRASRKSPRSKQKQAGTAADPMVVDDSEDEAGPSQKTRRAMWAASGYTLQDESQKFAAKFQVRC